MKNLVLLATLIAASLGFSSCCSLSNLGSSSAGTRTETVQKRVCCASDVVTRQVVTPGQGGKGGMVETIEERVPRYRTVTRTVKIPCGKCTRFYCPKKDCCGTTSESTMRMASMQGGSGSPNLGLIPTMKPLPLGPVAITP